MYFIDFLTYDPNLNRPLVLSVLYLSLTPMERQKEGGEKGVGGS